MNLTPAQLRLLTEVERSGSLAQAAVRLGVTASAVSQQLTKLEKATGVSLVERTSKGAQLTPLGTELANHGRRIAFEIDAAEQAVNAFNTAHVDRLRVGAPPSLSVWLLPDALAATRFRRPEANLSVVEVGSDDGVRWVADGVLDIALAATYDRDEPGPEVTGHALLDEPMVAVLADDHPLADEPGPLPLELLADEDWVSGGPNRPLRRQLDQAGAAAGFVPRVPFVTESFDVAQSLADVGVAIALLPATAVDPRLRTAVRPVAPALSRRVRAITSARRTAAPLTAEFLTDLTRIAKSAPIVES